MQAVKEQLAAEKGSHAFTLEQLNEARAQVEQAHQISEGLRIDLKHAQQQLAETLMLQNEKIEDLHRALSASNASREELQRLFAEQQSINSRLTQEHKISEANVAALSKHIRDLKSSEAPSDSTSGALARERELHTITRKQLEEEKKKTHTYIHP